MRDKVVLLGLFGLLILVAIFVYFSRTVNNKTDNEKYFAYLGNPQLMSSLKIYSKRQVSFYVAKGTYKDKTAIFFVNADEIDQAVQKKEPIIGGNNLVVELVPEWIEGAHYKLRFRQGLVPIIIFSKCQGKTEECYLENIKNIVRKSLDEDNPQFVDTGQIQINKQIFEIIEAEPKNIPNSRGCYPTNYQLIKYNGDWYTFRTSDLCRD